jgi:hypothetical protein
MRHETQALSAGCWRGRKGPPARQHTPPRPRPPLYTPAGGAGTPAAGGPTREGQAWLDVASGEGKAALALEQPRLCLGVQCGFAG